MPRVNVDISHQLDQALDRFLPWGTRSEIVRVLLEQLVEEYEAKGFSAIEAIINRKRSIFEGGADHEAGRVARN